MSGSLHSQNPWKTNDSDFPRNGSRSDQLAFCINYAVLAPSVQNTQPWLFKPLANAIELYADRSRQLTVSDPHARDLIISCGAALTNLVIAIHYFGYEVSVQYCPESGDPDLLARVRIGRTRQSGHLDDALFRSIRRRRSIRQPFQPRPVPHELLRRLIWIASEYRCWLYLAESGTIREQIADLVQEAHLLQMNDVDYQAERAAWIDAGDPSRRNGTGSPNALDWQTLEPTQSDPGQCIMFRDQGLLSASPVLVVLGTSGDTPREWLQTGEALQRMLLRAEMEGVSASLMNQPVQIADLRDELRQITGRAGPPQLLLRMGYARSSEPAYRRPVADVIRSSVPG
jgi:hypothetical protein